VDYECDGRTDGQTESPVAIARSCNNARYKLRKLAALLFIGNISHYIFQPDISDVVSANCAYNLNADFSNPYFEVKLGRRRLATLS